MSTAFPYVIVSGYRTKRQVLYAGFRTWATYKGVRYRTAEIARISALEVGARRKHLAIVKNFGTKLERVVWERVRK